MQAYNFVIHREFQAHPSLTELERKKLCSFIDTGALSLGACVHAASNEHLPLRVIVQVMHPSCDFPCSEELSYEVLSFYFLGCYLGRDLMSESSLFQCW